MQIQLWSNEYLCSLLLELCTHRLLWVHQKLCFNKSISCWSRSYVKENKSPLKSVQGESVRVVAAILCPPLLWPMKRQKGILGPQTVCQLTRQHALENKTVTSLHSVTSLNIFSSVSEFGQKSAHKSAAFKRQRGVINLFFVNNLYNCVSKKKIIKIFKRQISTEGKWYANDFNS